MAHSPHTEHLFKGVCICPCGDCTKRVSSGGDRQYLVQCICPDCNTALCGARKPAG